MLLGDASISTTNKSQPRDLVALLQSAANPANWPRNVITPSTEIVSPVLEDRMDSLDHIAVEHADDVSSVSDESRGTENQPHKALQPQVRKALAPRTGNTNAGRKTKRGHIEGLPR